MEVVGAELRKFVTKVQLTHETGEVLPQFQSIPRSTEPTDQQEVELSHEEFLDVGSRVLLDVDIKSRLTTPEEDDGVQDHLQIGVGDGANECQSSATPATSLNKEADDKASSKHVRVPLPLSSIGVPTEDLPPVNRHHCTNSIPRIRQLGASLEPVDLVLITPTPVATPLETTIPQTHSPKTTLAQSSLFVNIPSEHDSVYDSPLYQYFPIRGQMTSALRLSPNPVSTPAPSPISPDRWGAFYQRQHPHNSQMPGGGKLSSNSIHRNSELESDSTWHARHRATLFSVRNMRDTSVPGYRSPVGGEWPLTSGHVFITEDRRVSTQVSPGLRGQGPEEWLGEKMQVNMMSDTNLGSLRSPSPGSKTYIPQDILAEFHGDPYGKKHTKLANLSLLGGQMNDNHTAFGLPEYPNDTDVFTMLARSPGWRLPCSRTPIQLSETVGRTAPKPTKQPSPDSVPKSITVKHLPLLREQRPKSTPPRGVSSQVAAVYQALSEASLVVPTSGATTAQTVLTSTTPCEGPMPPHPSPEPQFAQLYQTQMEALSEADECGSIVFSTADKGKRSATTTDDSINIEDGISNRNFPDTDVDNKGPIEQEIGHNVIEIDENLSVTDQEETRDVVKEVMHPTVGTCGQAESSDITGENTPLAQFDAHSTNMQPLIDEHFFSPISSTSNGSDLPYSPEWNNTSDALLHESGSVGGDTHLICSIEAVQDITLPCLFQTSPPAQEHPQLPGSPELELMQCDFSEGLDVNLDLEMELKLAMEGVDDLEL